jgi:hypothetical protein
VKGHFAPVFTILLTPGNPEMKEEKDEFPPKDKKMPHVKNNEKKLGKKVIRMEMSPNRKGYPGKTRVQEIQKN